MIEVPMWLLIALAVAAAPTIIFAAAFVSALIAAAILGK